jgi:hypothetical protein
MSNSRNKYKRPPFLAELLFKIYFPDEGRFTTLGDLNEVYSSVCKKSGVFKAKIWYWHQLVKSLLPFLTHSIYWGITMFFNFLKISFRNISRNKLSSIIRMTTSISKVT